VASNCACLGLYGPQSGDAVGPKTGRVVVVFVQRDPGDGPLGARGPFAQQRGLAKAGRRGDEGELAVQTRVQPLDQARARHQACPDRGNVEFGLQEGCVHLALSVSHQPVTLFVRRP